MEINDVAFVRSVLGNIIILQGDQRAGGLRVHMRLRSSFQTISRSLAPLNNYWNEFKHSTQFQCGTHSAETAQLSYAVCRLVLGKQQLAELVWEAFMLEEVLFWKVPFEFTLAYIWDKLDTIVKRVP